MSEDKKIGGIGPLGIPYSTTGSLEDKTHKLEAWMHWVEQVRREHADRKDEYGKGFHDGLKLALARFIVEFKKDVDDE